MGSRESTQPDPFKGKKKLVFIRNSTDLPESDGGKENVGCVHLQESEAHFAPQKPSQKLGL